MEEERCSTPIMVLTVILSLTSLIPHAHAQLTEAQLDMFREFDVIIYTDPDNSSQWIFNHSGIPHHEAGPWPGNPGNYSDQEHMYQIPKVPVEAETPGCLSLGIIAVAKNGVPFFNPYSGDGLNAVEVEALDGCQGHPQNTGQYHYHALNPIECGLHTFSEDELLGVALDGYPIYGPTTSYGGILRNLTSMELDPCHGWVRNGAFEYRVTFDFPYVLGCYHGYSTAAPPNNYGKKRRKRQMGPPPNGGQGPPPDGGQPGQGPPDNEDSDDPYAWSARSCIYTTFCETPANGCQCAAYVYDADAPRTSGQDTCEASDSASMVNAISFGSFFLLAAIIQLLM